MKPILKTSVLSVLLVLASTNELSADANAPRQDESRDPIAASLSISVHEHDRLSLDARDVPLALLLRRLAEDLGIELVQHVKLPDIPRSLTVKNKPMGAALDAVTRGLAVATFYGPGGRVREIHVFGLAPGSLPDRSNPAIQFLEDDGFDGASLRNYIATGSAEQKIKAIDRLQGMQDSLSINQLQLFAREDPESVVRSRAIDELARLGQMKGLEIGLADPVPAVRGRTVEAIGTLVDPGTVTLLAQVLLGDSAAEVRLAAARVLATLPDESARLFLREAGKDRDPEVSNFVRSVLGQYPSESEAPR